MGSVTIRPSKGMFNDEEVGTEAHDRIVNWLSLPENFAQAAEIVFGRRDGHWLDSAPQIEHAITSGRNNFLLGFADLTAPGVLVEVKTGTIRTGELLRQVNAYRSAIRFESVWLVTPQKIDHTSIEVLQNQGVNYVHFSWNEDPFGTPIIQADYARQHNLKSHLAEVRRAVLRYLNGLMSVRNAVLGEQDVLGINVSLRESEYLVTLPVFANDPRFGIELTNGRLLKHLKSWDVLPQGTQLELRCKEPPASLSEQFEALPTDFWTNESEGG